MQLKKFWSLSLVTARDIGQTCIVKARQEHSSLCAVYFRKVYAKNSQFQKMDPVNSNATLSTVVLNLQNGIVTLVTEREIWSRLPRTETGTDGALEIVIHVCHAIIRS